MLTTQWIAGPTDFPVAQIEALPDWAKIITLFAPSTQTTITEITVEEIHWNMAVEPFFDLSEQDGGTLHTAWVYDMRVNNLDDLLHLHKLPADTRILRINDYTDGGDYNPNSGDYTAIWTTAAKLLMDIFGATHTELGKECALCHKDISADPQAVTLSQEWRVYTCHKCYLEYEEKHEEAAKEDIPF